MNPVLKRKVFVLNRLWQLINETTVEEAIKQMASRAATGLDFRGDEDYYPVTWDEWLSLEPLNKNEIIHTPRFSVRMPTVIIAVNYDKIPKRRPKLTLKNIAKRDGNKCQYTGKILTPSEMSMDHVDPISRGGKNEPENIVLAEKKFNSWKSNRTPEELGIPRPKIKKLTAFTPEPSHPHHEKFKY